MKTIKELGKPTKETEMLRIWDKGKDKECKKDYKGFMIDLGDGIEMKAIDFTEMRDKKTNELVFAYKFKHEAQFILYYIPKENKEIEKIMEFLKIIASQINYGLQDLKENMKSMKAEIKIMKKNDN